MAKLPAFQFYPGDWMKDPNLRRCSHAAKGVWIDMLCLMFECDERGVLASGGVPWGLDEIARAVGGAPDVALSCVEELLAKGVASRNGSGAIFSRRLVRDEQIRTERSKAGSVGGSKTQAKRQAKLKQTPEDEDEDENSSVRKGDARGKPPDWFDAWWDQYPHKVGKKAAQKAYSVARKVADHDTLMAGVAAYISSKPPDRPWCNPTTWLNQGRWEDQPATGGISKPKTGLAALTDAERASLWAFVLEREPGKAHMHPGQDDARPLMRKHLDDWRAA